MAKGKQTIDADCLKLAEALSKVFYREIRKQNLSDSSAARQAGVARTNLQALLYGESLPKMPTLYKLGRSLGLPLSEIFRRAEAEIERQRYNIMATALGYTNQTN